MRFLILFVMGFVFSVSANAANIKQLAKKNKLPVHVTANKLEAFDKKGIYKFFGNVVVTRGDMKLTADKMTVFKNLKTGDIYKIVCTGKVVMTQQDKIAKGDKAVYESDKQKITLTGNASVKSDKNTITSDIIVYYINKDYAVAQSTSAEKRVEVTIYPNKKEKK